MDSKECKKTIMQQCDDILPLIHILCKDFFLWEQLLKLSQKIIGCSKETFECTMEVLLDYQLIHPRDYSDLHCTVYVLSKTVIAHLDNLSTNQCKLPKLTCSKIKKQAFLLDYLISDILPLMEEDELELSSETILEYCREHFYTLFHSYAPDSILEFYQEFKDKICGNIEIDTSTYFGRDYAIAQVSADIYRTVFLEGTSDIPPEYLDIYQEYKEIQEELTSTKFLKEFYSLSSFVRNGCVFLGLPSEYGWEIMCIDYQNCFTNRRLARIICFFARMLKRYMGEEQEISVTIISDDQKNLQELEESDQSFYFKRMGLSPDNISISYYWNDLESKYGIY